MKKGCFFAFEGVDGCGKTTQIQLTHEWLKSCDVKHVLTREPGGVPCADAIRDLLAHTGNSWSFMGQAFLLNAGRVEHTERLIKPALDAGQHVLTDRYVDSTLAYQGGGDGDVVDCLLKIHHLALGDFFPTITFFLDIGRETAYGRLQRRGHKEAHAFEKLKSVQERARKGYAYLCKRFPERFVCINAEASVEKIFALVQEKVQEYLV